MMVTLVDTSTIQNMPSKKEWNPDIFMHSINAEKLDRRNSEKFEQNRIIRSRVTNFQNLIKFS